MRDSKWKSTPRRRHSGQAPACSRKSKERLRLNSIKILNFDSRDDIKVQEAFSQVQCFITGLHLTYGLTKDDILAALQAAHRASDEYFTMRHTEAWDTTFTIPQSDIDEDLQLFRDMKYDFTSMCRHKQNKLASNRISPARILELIRAILGYLSTLLPTELHHQLHRRSDRKPIMFHH